MNSEWYSLAPEVETLFEWLASKKLWKKSRYTFPEIQEELEIEQVETLRDRIEQLQEYNRRAAGNLLIVECDGIQGEYWVDIQGGAAGAWADYEKERRLRMCPECGIPGRVERKIQWCPHCRKAFGLPDS